MSSLPIRTAPPKHTYSDGGCFCARLRCLDIDTAADSPSAVRRAMAFGRRPRGRLAHPYRGGPRLSLAFASARARRNGLSLVDWQRVRLTVATEVGHHMRRWELEERRRNPSARLGVMQAECREIVGLALQCAAVRTTPAMDFGRLDPPESKTMRCSPVPPLGGRPRHGPGEPRPHGRAGPQGGLPRVCCAKRARAHERFVELHALSSLRG